MQTIWVLDQKWSLISISAVKIGFGSILSLTALIFDWDDKSIFFFISRSLVLLLTALKYAILSNKIYTSLKYRSWPSTWIKNQIKSFKTFFSSFEWIWRNFSLFCLKMSIFEKKWKYHEKSQKKMRFFEKYCLILNWIRIISKGRKKVLKLVSERIGCR